MPGVGTGRSLRPSPHVPPIDARHVAQQKAAFGNPARLLRLLFGLQNPRPGFTRAFPVYDSLASGCNAVAAGLIEVVLWRQR